MDLLRTSLKATVLCCLTVVSLQPVSGQSPTEAAEATEGRKNATNWKRIRPESWFSVVVPRKKYQIIHAADANAVAYIGGNIEIHYIYWLYENTPHFIQWARENGPTDADPQMRIIFSRRVRVGRLTGLFTKYKQQKSDGTSKYVLNIHFPKVRLMDSGEVRLGELEFSVTYGDLRNEATARRIIRSLKLHRESV